MLAYVALFTEVRWNVAKQKKPVDFKSAKLEMAITNQTTDEQLVITGRNDLKC